MKTIRSAVIALFCSVLTFNAYAQITCQSLDGSVVFSQESNPQYLGFFGNEFAVDSIMNEFSLYGSPFGVNSVRNEFSPYGSPFGVYSANNDFSSTPPVIFRDETFIGFLTTNQFQTPGVSLAVIDTNCSFLSSVPYEGGSLPPPPTGVEASDGTFTDKVLVTWNAASGATAYNVYTSESLSSTKTYLGQIAGTAAEVTGITPGVVLYFWIFSANANGESTTGDYDTGYIGGSLPEPPSQVSASDGTFSDKIEITWTAVGDATTYNVYYSQTLTSEQTLLGTYPGTSVNATGSSPGAIWYFWVYSENAIGESATGTYDTGFIADTGVTVPATPTLNSAVAGDSQARLHFVSNGNGGSEITSYRADCGAFSQAGSASPLTVNGLTNGNEYACSVVATNIEGDSAPSNVLFVTPAAASVFQINAGLNDAWVTDDAPLQGMFFTIFEDLNALFMAWFTFDSVIPGGPVATFGANDQRWVTGLGIYSGNEVTINIELTSGGIFNDSVPLAEQTPNYGTITIVFNNCNEAILTYSFPSLGLSGELTLTRVLTSNVALCEALSTP